MFCAKGLSDGLVYAALGQKAIAGSGRRVEVIGPAWAKAYGARGFSCAEKARYHDARRELQKTMALSPLNSRYQSKPGYVWGRRREWNKLLALYRDAHDDAVISGFGGAAEVATLQCKALRGQGYVLVDLDRLDEAVNACQACLKAQPGEPRSLGALE